MRFSRPGSLSPGYYTKSAFLLHVLGKEIGNAGVNKVERRAMDTAR